MVPSILKRQLLGSTLNCFQPLHLILSKTKTHPMQDSSFGNVFNSFTFIIYSMARTENVSLSWTWGMVLVNCCCCFLYLYLYLSLAFLYIPFAYTHYIVFYIARRSKFSFKLAFLIFLFFIFFLHLL